MKKLKVAFFGTPDFAVPSLEILANHCEVELVSVVSMPDRKSGRGMSIKSPEVIEYARAKKISYFQSPNINNEKSFLEDLRKKDLDVIIVLAFAQFLGNDILSLPRLGCFNIHTSLLPKYRGAAPIQYALLNGDKTSGVSIQKMVKKMDAGDLALSSPIKLHVCETGGQLYTRLKFKAALCLNDFIYELNAGELSFEKQDEQMVSFAPTLKREDGKIDFKSSKVTDIKNKVRALHPWPGTFCLLNDKRLKLYEITDSVQDLSPGEVDISLNQLHIGCKDGSLRLKYLQLEGKKPCLDSELLNGLKGKPTIN